MKTTPTFRLLTLLLFLFILGGFPIAVTGFKRIQIQDSGVYIITLVSDPPNDGQTRVRLQLNSKDTIFIAYGDDNVIGGLSVALPLKHGDFVRAKAEGPRDRNSVISFSIVFVSSSKKYFTTVHSDGWLHTDKTVGFLSYITESGSWTHYPYKRILYSVPRDGVYWIMTRPDPPTGHWTTVNIMGLFNAYTGHGVPISASGAFYLTTEDKVSAMYAKTYGLDENVAFGGSKLLDCGGMYNKSSHVFSFSISGAYILSLRGNPRTKATLRLQVYRNNKVAFQSFAQRGVSSGQATPISFDRGDTMYVRARDDRYVGKHTMMSIALLYKTDLHRLDQ